MTRRRVTPLVRIARWITLILIVFASASLEHAADSADERDPVLIEIGRDDFGESGSYMPMVSPRAPDLQIRTSGVIRFLRDGSYWQGTVEQRVLRRLRARLARMDLLAQSRVVESRGRMLGMHGGMWWIRYVRGAGDEVFLVAPNRPTRGPLAALAGHLWSLVPNTYGSYIPERASLLIWSSQFRCEDCEPWPFSAELSLERAVSAKDISVDAGTFPPVETTDPRVIHFLVRRGTFATVSESSRNYYVLIVGAPAWYPPADVGWKLYSVWVEHYGIRVRE